RRSRPRSRRWGIRGAEKAVILGALPLGVTGNTPDSGSGESWFEPRRGNSKRDAQMMRVALLVFLGRASVLQAFMRPSWNRHASLAADFPVPKFHRRAHHFEH